MAATGGALPRDHSGGVKVDAAQDDLAALPDTKQCVPVRLRALPTSHSEASPAKVVFTNDFVKKVK